MNKTENLLIDATELVEIVEKEEFELSLFELDMVGGGNSAVAF